MIIQRITKREVIIAIVALMVGVGLGFYINSNEVKINKEITKRIIDNCTESLTATNTLVDSWRSAYNELGTCAINVQACDAQESARKLEALNNKKKQAEEELQSLTRDMDSIIEEVKRIGLGD